MSNAAKTVDAFETADGYRVGTSPVGSSPEEALALWAEDESYDPGEARYWVALLVLAVNKVTGPVRGQWSNVAQEAVDRVMSDFHADYSSEVQLHFPNFYSVRRVITEALDDLTRDMPVTAYVDEPVATREYSREQVAEILQAAGVWK